tara:strand:+ start:680 stop:1195 length:516 start_codon:yes stop_codon:yes gene_type:complete
MKFLKLISIVFISFGIFPPIRAVLSESNDSSNYKVLSSTNQSFSIANVESYIFEGDKFVKIGDFEKAKKSFKKARNLSKKLAIFYLDINNSFKGKDARIPKEMQRKGLEILKIQAKSNERLAAIHLRDQEPEVAVPLLVEIIRIMSPSSIEGKKAYKNLIKLGFVETPYKG